MGAGVSGPNSTAAHRPDISLGLAFTRENYNDWLLSKRPHQGKRMPRWWTSMLFLIPSIPCGSALIASIVLVGR